MPMLEAEALTGRAIASVPLSPDGDFMIMPGGVQSIQCGQGDRTVNVTIAVDRSSANALEEQRALLASKSNHRPFFDFDHDDKMASFWPTQFYWATSPAPGVYAKGDWSDAGRKAIEGKRYRAFSPKFHVDSTKRNPARVICYEGASLNMGGLVNDPAFKNNLPLWAKAAAANGCNTTAATPHNAPRMNTKEQVAALQAKLDELKQEHAALSASNAGTAEEADVLAAKQREIAELQREIETEALKAKTAELEQQVYLQREKDADGAVKTAVRKGAIPAKDTELQASWKKKCIEDPGNIELLSKIPGSSALNPQFPARLTLGHDLRVLRTSNEDVLKGMSALCARQRGDVTLYSERPKIAREVAALYAKEILPRLKEGDDIPLSATNSLGTLAQTLVSTRTLELLQLTFPLLQAIVTDFSDQIVSYGDTLKSRYITIPAVQTFNTSTGWPTQSDHVTTDVSITYDQFKGVPIRILGHESAGTVRRLFDEVSPAQAYALGKNIVDFVYALITTAFTNTVTQAGLGTFGRSTIIDMGGILDDAGNPEMGRCLLLNRPYYSALAKDNTIIQLAAFQRASIIEQGVEPTTLQDVEGFRVIKAVNLPATVISGSTVLKGFAFTRSALCLATRLSADYVNALPGAANGNLTVVTTPGGFSANLVQFVDHNGAYTAQRLEVIYGASRGQPAAGALLTDV